MGNAVTHRLHLPAWESSDTAIRGVKVAWRPHARVPQQFFHAAAALEARPGLNREHGNRLYRVAVLVTCLSGRFGTATRRRA
jgi:hypothetical protein